MTKELTMIFCHLLGQQSISFNDHDSIDDVLLKSGVTNLMFTSWMDVIQNFLRQKIPPMPNLYTKIFVKRNSCWKPSKSEYYYWKAYLGATKYW